MKRFLWVVWLATWPLWLGGVALMVAQFSDVGGTVAAFAVLAIVCGDVLRTYRRLRHTRGRP